MTMLTPARCRIPRTPWGLAHLLYHRLWLSRKCTFRIIDEFTAEATAPSCRWCPKPHGIEAFVDDSPVTLIQD